jgi:hypothetical protein
MNPRRPPALVVWFLDRYGYTAVNPALTGDLYEEFQQGRSAYWYWRQAFNVAATFPRRMGILPALLAAAFFTGFLLEFPVAYAVWRLPAFADPTGVWGSTLEWAFLITLLLLVTFPARYSLSPTKRAIARGAFVFRDALAVVAAEALLYFGAFFLSDCLALRLETFSFGELAICHFVWLPMIALILLRDLTPGRSGLLPAAYDRLPPQELTLPVRARRGRTIILRPESLDEALFACEDSTLRHILRKAPSLAVLRRAIWLGSARNYQSDLLGESPVLTLSGLTSLIYEAARTENLADAAAIPIPGEVTGVEHELVLVKE